MRHVYVALSALAQRRRAGVGGSDREAGGKASWRQGGVDDAREYDDQWVAMPGALDKKSRKSTGPTPTGGSLKGSSTGRRSAGGGGGNGHNIFDSFAAVGGHYPVGHYPVCAPGPLGAGVGALEDEEDQDYDDVHGSGAYLLDRAELSETDDHTGRSSRAGRSSRRRPAGGHAAPEDDDVDGYDGAELDLPPVEEPPKKPKLPVTTVVAPPVYIQPKGAPPPVRTAVPMSVAKAAAPGVAAQARLPAPPGAARGPGSVTISSTGAIVGVRGPGPPTSPPLTTVIVAKQPPMATPLVLAAAPAASAQRLAPAPAAKQPPPLSPPPRVGQAVRLHSTLSDASGAGSQTHFSSYAPSQGTPNRPASMASTPLHYSGGVTGSWTSTPARSGLPGQAAAPASSPATPATTATPASAGASPLPRVVPGSGLAAVGGHVLPQAPPSAAPSQGSLASLSSAPLTSSTAGQMARAGLASAAAPAGRRRVTREELMASGCLVDASVATLAPAVESAPVLNSAFADGGDVEFGGSSVATVSAPATRSPGSYSRSVGVEPQSAAAMYRPTSATSSQAGGYGVYGGAHADEFLAEAYAEAEYDEEEYLESPAFDAGFPQGFAHRFEQDHAAQRLRAS